MHYYPTVKIIEHEQMLGFSTNNNLAFSMSSGRFLMLLNDDTVVKQGAFQEIVKFLDVHTDVGAVGRMFSILMVHNSYAMTIHLIQFMMAFVQFQNLFYQYQKAMEGR